MSMSISDMYKEMIEQMYELSLYNMQENDITNYDDCSVDSDIELDYTTQSQSSCTAKC